MGSRSSIQRPSKESDRETRHSCRPSFTNTRVNAATHPPVHAQWLFGVECSVLKPSSGIKHSDNQRLLFFFHLFVGSVSLKTLEIDPVPWLRAAV